ncbi:MAG: HAMP domain-containing protein [SAR202 cluster bacterium]|nr:HAMP domain-containing protein [SAR202 cluster bacterium]
MKLNIRTKLIGGFIGVLALLVLLGGVAIMRIGQVNAALQNLSGNLATDELLAQTIVSQVLEMRFFANKYINEQKPEYLDDYDEQTSRLDKTLRDAIEHEQATDPQRVETLEAIQEDYENYTGAFSEIAQILDDRTKIQTQVLDVQGPLAQKLLRELALGAFKANDSTSAFYAGEAEASMNLVRLDAFKYLQYGNEEWVAKFQERFEETQSNFEALERVLQNPERQKLAADALGAVNVYHSGFESLVEDYKRQQELRTEVLDVVGKDIQSVASDMSEEIHAQFEAASLAADALVTQTRTLLIILTIVAVAVGLALAWFLSRALSNSVRTMVTASADLASRVFPSLVDVMQTVATGDLSKKHEAQAEQVTVKSKDEVGELAAAFNQMLEQVEKMGAATNEMMESLRKRAQTAEQIAAGDLTVKAEAAGEQDVLGNAFARMVSALRNGSANVAEAIAAGNLNVKATSRSENDVLGNAFVKMVDTLKLKTQVAEAIADGDLDVEITVDSEQDVLGKAFQRMVETLKDRARLAEAIANGDLSVSAKPRSEKDVLGNAFSKMVDSLRGLISKVGTTAGDLANASSQLTAAAEEAGRATQEIAANSQELAGGAQQQSDSAQETTNAMSQLSQAIDQIAQGSQQQAGAVEQAAAIVGQVSKATAEGAKSSQAAADGARQANESARNGASVMEKTVNGMGRIKGAVSSAVTKIAELGQLSTEIGKIVAVIDDIAAQTNLLALNAAIEAARAGEQGRGFAVVAERVTEATKEIANLIDNVQKGVGDSIKAAEEGSKEVAEGSALADEAGKALEQIMAAVEAVAQQLEQISAAAEEVSAAGDEMVKTIDGVSTIVEQNSAAAEEMAANSSEVNRVVERVASVAQQNQSSTQQVSASADGMSAQVEQVIASAQSLDDMAKELQRSVSAFNLGGQGNLREREKVLVA